ncbi:MAG: hypothetical protein D6690_02995 [Nitrospirae bacterium]|nr:MAG: hypothetical protein D6690_02995 [Nitrospirota bacterium]
MIEAPKPGFAVDIDNVVAKAEPEVQRLYQEISGKPWPRGLYGSAGGLDHGGLDREVVEELFVRFHEYSIPHLPVLPGAKMALAVLHERYRIVMITARRPTSRPQTLAWLEKHGIPFDELYHAEEKTGIPENIIMAVDDHPVHLYGYVNSGIRTFIMDQPWNRHLSHPSMQRVLGWDHLLSVLHVSSSVQWPTSLQKSSSPQRLLRAMGKHDEIPPAAVGA